MSQMQIRKRDGHGKSRNGHGNVMEKYFVKYVGTLITGKGWATKREGENGTRNCLSGKIQGNWKSYQNTGKFAKTQEISWS